MDMVESARQFRAAVQLYAGTLSDEEAVTVESLYPLWEAGAAYDKGALLRHGGRLYRVEQAHTAQAHQPPSGEGMLAVYRPLQEPGEVLPWVYGEAVSIGDRRIDPSDGLVYEVYAEAGANLWEPHTAPAIWRLVEEEEEDVNAAENTAAQGEG